MNTALTDGARKKKTAKYLTKAQAEAVVIKFVSLCNTATILRRVMNAMDQQEHVTFFGDRLVMWHHYEGKASRSYNANNSSCTKVFQVVLTTLWSRET